MADKNQQLQKYGSFSDEDWEQADRSMRSGTGFWKPGEGSNIVRFMPPRKGEKLILSYQQHFVKKADGTSFGFACPALNGKPPRRCPACEKVRQLAAGNSSDQKVADDMRAKPRALANIIDRKDPDAGAKVFAFGKMVVGQLKDVNETCGPFFDPFEGFDINVKRKGTMLNTEYNCIASRKTSPLHEDPEAIDTIITGQPDLSKYAVIMDPDKIIEKCGWDQDEFGPPVAKAKPVSAKPAGAKTPPQAVIDVDTGFDDEDAADPDIDF